MVQRYKQDILPRAAARMRVVTTIAILIFITCYILGATGTADLSRSGYLLIATITSALFGGAFAVRLYFTRKGAHPHSHWRRLPIAVALLFAAGWIEFYAINHARYYWMILAFLVGSLILDAFEFVSRLKAVWYGRVHSREKTLGQFIYLYAATVFTFALLYTILQVYSDEPVFHITYESDSLLDFLYLSIVTVSTLGYGDIIPISSLAKFLVMVQTVIGYLYLSIMLGLMVSWMSSRSREPETNPSEGPPKDG